MVAAEDDDMMFVDFYTLQRTQVTELGTKLCFVCMYNGIFWHTMFLIYPKDVITFSEQTTTKQKMFTLQISIPAGLMTE